MNNFYWHLDQLKNRLVLYRRGSKREYKVFNCAPEDKNYLLWLSMQLNNDPKKCTDKYQPTKLDMQAVKALVILKND